MASSVFTRKTAPPPWQPYINKTNVFTKFHDDWAKNVTSRVFTSFFYYIKIRKIHVFQRTGTILKSTLVSRKQMAKIVTSRVFTCFHYIHKEKTAPPTGGHVFSPIWTILELVRDINKTNVSTKFHDDWAKNVTS
ncbi:hypothetical protein DPMN_010907 [Dreissena polymorpha]|uniref:Uncharacterized protein n=1 Tax=Dreissena polymorpha TaxID=45954 RepID=A0A9D4N414_DREPO|nr:hypothetical protein DPMN_010907 [Dreissena polymorpha]